MKNNIRELIASLGAAALLYGCGQTEFDPIRNADIYRVANLRFRVEIVGDPSKQSLEPRLRIAPVNHKTSTTTPSTYGYRGSAYNRSITGKYVPHTHLNVLAPSQSTDEFFSANLDTLEHSKRMLADLASMMYESKAVERLGYGESKLSFQVLGEVSTPLTNYMKMEIDEAAVSIYKNLLEAGKKKVAEFNGTIWSVQGGLSMLERERVDIDMYTVIPMSPINAMARGFVVAGFIDDPYVVHPDCDTEHTYRK